MLIIIPKEDNKNIEESSTEQKNNLLDFGELDIDYLAEILQIQMN